MFSLITAMERALARQIAFSQLSSVREIIAKLSLLTESYTHLRDCWHQCLKRVRVRVGPQHAEKKGYPNPFYH
jgi:hypothetical protein